MSWVAPLLVEVKPPPAPVRAVRKPARESAKNRQEAKRLRAMGKSYADIGRALGVSRQVAHYYVNGAHDAA